VPLRSDPVRDTWQPALPGSNAYHGAHHAIVLVNAGNYGGPPGTIGRGHGWRADRQPSSPAYANIQIQRDGFGSPSTIACALVDVTLRQRLYAGAPGTRQLRDTSRFRELTNAINSALNQSLSSRRESDSGGWELLPYRVSGSFSS